MNFATYKLKGLFFAFGFAFICCYCCFLVFVCLFFVRVLFCFLMGDDSVNDLALTLVFFYAWRYGLASNVVLALDKI